MIKHEEYERVWEPQYLCGFAAFFSYIFTVSFLHIYGVYLTFLRCLSYFFTVSTYIKRRCCTFILELFSYFFTVSY